MRVLPRMPEGELNEPPLEENPTLPRRWVLVVWAGLTLSLVPAFFFIRAAALEVTQYHVNVFEGYARAALAAGDYDRVLELCTGALHASVNRSDHYGKVYSLRAQAYAGQGNYRDALNELESAAAFWTQRYYYASDDDRSELARLGTDLGQKLIASENYEDARRAYSAAGMGSGRPVEYLYDLRSALDAGQQGKLWPEGAVLVVQDFRQDRGNLFLAQLDEQGRTVTASSIDPKGSLSGGPSAYMALTASTGEGRSLYGVDTYLPLSEKRFGLRVFLREDPGLETNVTLSYWFEAARVSVSTRDAATVALPDGWRRFEILRDFYGERLLEANQQGYVVTDGIINKISLEVSPGPACRFWVDRIELFIPEASAPNS